MIPPTATLSITMTMTIYLSSCDSGKEFVMMMIKPFLKACVLGLTWNANVTGISPAMEIASLG